MPWSLSRSRQVAVEVRAAPLANQAVASARPRSVLGIVRSRAPLALLLFVASRDGLVVEQDGGGFAILQRPALSRPLRSGGYGLRVLRWLDRRWDTVLFTGPPLLGLLIAVVTAWFPATRFVALAGAVLALFWVFTFLMAMMAFQLRWMSRMGAPSTSDRGRSAESLPAYHWSASLVHQPDPDRVEELTRLLTEQLVRLIHTEVQAIAGDRIRLGNPDVTETLVVLTNGITTPAARAAMAESLRAIRDYPTEGDVIVLSSPGRLEKVPSRPIAGGGFLLLYITGLAVAIAVCARWVADAEARSCLPSACSGRPATYPDALRWLLQRLLLSDPPGLAPGTVQNLILGWLVSAAAMMLVVVLFVAARQEIARNKRVGRDHDETLGAIQARGRVLILVVTAVERDAVLKSVRRHVGRDAVLDHVGERTVHILGSIAGTELLLAQAVEQGTASAGGMLVTARTVIDQCRPDYVVLTGICYGLRPDEGQHIGDVVIGRRVQNLDHRKLTENADRPVIYRGVNVGCSPGLLDRFQAALPSWPGVRVHIGTVLTSNALINSEPVIASLREDFPDAIAGEMEATGVHEAANLGVKPDWIMVKGISDWGYCKTNHGQSQAARSAADFVTHVVASGALRRRRT